MEEEKFIQQLFEQNKKHFNRFPDKQLASSFVNDLFDLLFASYTGKYETATDVQKRLHFLKQQFGALLSQIVNDAEERDYLNKIFFNSLSDIYVSLLLDAEAVLKFDPAAHSIEEVLVAYPGFYAIAVYRIAHQLHRQQIKILPRLFGECAHSKTGIDIHPAAVIGSSFFIDHGTGIVIGETSVIGNDVKIYQGVTLGAINVSKEYASVKRHPTIEQNVVIYSGATILGGETIIGANSIIGGNVWLTYSVPPHSVVYHKSEIKVRDNNPFAEEFNFVI